MFIPAALAPPLPTMSPSAFSFESQTHVYIPVHVQARFFESVYIPASHFSPCTTCRTVANVAASSRTVNKHRHGVIRHPPWRHKHRYHLLLVQGIYIAHGTNRLHEPRRLVQLHHRVRRDYRLHKPRRQGLEMIQGRENRLLMQGIQMHHGTPNMCEIRFKQHRRFDRHHQHRRPRGSNSPRQPQ